MTNKKPFDAGDEKQVKENKTNHALVRQQEIEELKFILSTYGGRAFIWRLLSKCGVYRAASGDPYEVARGEGKRDIGLWTIEELFTSAPEAYTIMRNEAASRDAKQKGK